MEIGKRDLIDRLVVALQGVEIKDANSVAEKVAGYFTWDEDAKEPKPKPKPRARSKKK